MRKVKLWIINCIIISIIISSSNAKTKSSFVSTERSLALEAISCIDDTHCLFYDLCSECSTSTGQCIPKTTFSRPCPTRGDPKVLVIRINALDVATTGSSSELKDALFGIFGKGFTMKSQFSACSHGKFNPIPYSGITTTNRNILNGVAEITLPQNVIGAQAIDVADAAISVATTDFGDLEEQFDLVLLCIPPGTKIGASLRWKGYAYLSSYLSVYNDLNCLYPSVAMHEIGHNLGLAHSNDEKNYGDESGYMGISYNRTDGPLKCYNGPKSWELGWFRDSHVVHNVKSLGQAEYILVGLSDYDVRGDYNTILKIVNMDDGYDYFITFNAMTKMNIGTTEGGNQVLITKLISGHESLSSHLLAKLKSNDDYILSDYSEVNGQERVQIKSEIFSGNIPYARISIFRGVSLSRCTHDTHCDDFNDCTIDTCDPSLGYSCRYTPQPCPICGTHVEVSVITNQYPDETLWSIENINRDMIVQASGYYSSPNTLYEDSFCLEYGRYRFSTLYYGNRTETGNVTFTLTTTGEVLDEEEGSENIFIDTLFTICRTDQDCQDFDGCTEDYCNVATKLCEYYVVGNCTDCTWFSLDLETDNYPDETSWEVLQYNSSHVSETAVLSGNPCPVYLFSYGRSKAPTKGRSKAPTRGRSKAPTRGRSKAPTRGRSKAPTRMGRAKAPTRILQGHNKELDYQALLDDDLISEEICLQNGHLYIFVIRDSFGDGICCTEGTGSYTVKFDGKIIHTGGNFLQSEQFLLEYVGCESNADCSDDNQCTIDSCDLDISTCVYYVTSCEHCGALVTIDLITDDYPQSIKWEVLKDNVEVLSQGPFLRSEWPYKTSKCLPFGTYKFTMYESVGAYETASDRDKNVGYSLIVGGDILHEGGANYKFKDHVFVICQINTDCDDGDECTMDSCDNTKNICVHTYDCAFCGKELISVEFNSGEMTYDTSWDIWNGATNMIEEASGSFHQSGHSYKSNTCVYGGSYKFTFYAKHNWRECGEQDCAYKLIVNDEIIKEGGGDFYSESTDFIVLSSFLSYNESVTIQPTSSPSENITTTSPSDLSSNLVPSFTPILSNFTTVPTSSPQILFNSSDFPSSIPTSSPSEYIEPKEFKSCTESTVSGINLINLMQGTTSTIAESPLTYAITVDVDIDQHGATFSESQAYSMLATAITLGSIEYTDPHRNSTIELFYGYFNGWKRMCKTSAPSPCLSSSYCTIESGKAPCLPGWKHNADLTAVLGKGSKTDSDEYAILGMIIAIKALEKDRPEWYDSLKQWADESCTQFLSDNTVLSTSKSHRLLKLGTCWGGWEYQGNNPSYYGPGAYRAMRDYHISYDGARNYVMPDFGDALPLKEKWNMLINSTYKFYNATQCSETGLIPNWALVTETNGTVSNLAGSFSGSNSPQKEFGYEASRTMWKVALDALLYPDEARVQARVFLEPIHNKLHDSFDVHSKFFSNSTLQTCSTVKSVPNDWQQLSYVFGPLYSTLSVQSSLMKENEQQLLVNTACLIIGSSSNLEGYYSLIWKILSLLILNGDVEKVALLFNSGDVAETQALFKTRNKRKKFKQRGIA